MWTGCRGWQERDTPDPVVVLQVDELRSRIRELEERDRRESKKIADEDALRRIRQAEEQIEHLQRKLGATKQVRPWALHPPALCSAVFPGVPMATCPSVPPPAGGGGSAVGDGRDGPGF